MKHQTKHLKEHSKVASEESPIVSEKENESLPSDAMEEGSETGGKEKRDMSHVESMIDSLDDDELSHAHEHIKKKMEPSKDEVASPEPSYNDFTEYKKKD